MTHDCRLGSGWQGCLEKGLISVLRGKYYFTRYVGDNIIDIVLLSYCAFCGEEL
jgi:hypothetical protein